MLLAITTDKVTLLVNDKNHKEKTSQSEGNEGKGEEKNEGNETEEQKSQEKCRENLWMADCDG